jgi:hypothetical protein
LRQPRDILRLFLYASAPPASTQVIDLCEALKSPAQYGNKLVVMTNTVLLPWQDTPQTSPTLPNVPDLKKKLADRVAAIRKASGSTTRVVAVYGFLDIPDGLTAVRCAGDSCARPDILVPPASFLKVDGFRELK